MDPDPSDRPHPPLAPVDPRERGAPPPRARTDGGEEFGAALDALNADGAVMLVVGDVPAAAQRTVCRQLMGDDDVPRRRIVGLSGDGHGEIENRLPAGTTRDDDHLRVITDGTGVRDGVAAEPGGVIEGMSPDGTAIVTVEGEIGSFGAAITSAIVELEPHERDFEAGELRVGVDELRPLFEQVPEEDVVQFVHLLGHRVRQARGRAHFHLPVAADDQRASILATVCDILIDVQIRDGEPRQQWHVRNGPSSEWLPVPIDAD